MKSNKELYIQKLKAQLNEWQADTEKMKAKASGASATAQLEMKKHIKTLQSKIDEGKDKIAELNNTKDDAWDSVKDKAEKSWDSMKSAFNEAYKRIKH